MDFCVRIRNMGYDIKINNKAYKYESFWRPSYKEKVYDYNNNLLPYPKEDTIDWQNKKAFLEKLSDVQKIVIRVGNYTEYDRDNYKDCLLCHKKNITKGVFQINQIRWEEGLNIILMFIILNQVMNSWIIYLSLILDLEHFLPKKSPILKE